MEGVLPLENIVSGENDSGDVNGLENHVTDDDSYIIGGYTFNKTSLLDCLQTNIDDSLPESHRTYLRAAKNAIKSGEKLSERQIKQLGKYMRYFPGDEIPITRHIVEDLVSPPIVIPKPEPRINEFTTPKHKTVYERWREEREREGFGEPEAEESYPKPHKPVKVEGELPIYDLKLNPNNAPRVKKYSSMMINYIINEKFEEGFIGDREIWAASSKVHGEPLTFRRIREKFTSIFPADQQNQFDNASRLLEAYLKYLTVEGYVLDKENPFHAIPKARAA